MRSVFWLQVACGSYYRDSLKSGGPVCLSMCSVDSVIFPLYRRSVSSSQCTVRVAKFTTALHTVNSPSLSDAFSELRYGTWVNKQSKMRFQQLSDDISYSLPHEFV
jgi:hypothetical protein